MLFNNSRKQVHKHYRRAEKKVVHSQSSFIAAGVSFAAIVVFVLEICLAAASLNKVGAIVAGIGVLLMIASIVCLVIGLREYRIDTFSKISRLLGFIVPIISLSLWGLLYIIGLIFG